MPDLPRHVIRETGKIRSVRDSKKDRQKRQINSPGELELADRQLDRKKKNYRHRQGQADSVR